MMFDDDDYKCFDVAELPTITACAVIVVILCGVLLLAMVGAAHLFNGC
jgi:hypothetical protein